MKFNLLRKLRSACLMNSFPLLYSGARSPYIGTAYERVKKYYDKSRRLLAQEEPDILRLKIAADDLQYYALPFVRDLQKMAIVPRRWIERIASSCIGIEARLRASIEQLEHRGIDDTR